jgi:hypothetical protein
MTLKTYDVFLSVSSHRLPVKCHVLDYVTTGPALNEMKDYEPLKAHDFFVFARDGAIEIPTRIGVVLTGVEVAARGTAGTPASSTARPSVLYMIPDSIPNGTYNMWLFSEIKREFFIRTNDQTLYLFLPNRTDGIDVDQWMGLRPIGASIAEHMNKSVKRIIDEFPGHCPGCGDRAYIGFLGVQHQDEARAKTACTARRV